MKQAHILLDKTINAKYAILPGDPARLDHIKKYLDNPQELSSNREYRSLLGTYKGVTILSISTGIGGPSTAIAIEELYNIGVDTMIRIGSCGALQNDIEIGELILAEGAIRHEGTSKKYIESIYPATPDFELFKVIKETCESLKYHHQTGLVLTHDSFYSEDHNSLEKKWSYYGALGADLETSTLLTIARIKKIRAASILNNVVLYGQDTSESISSFVDGASSAIEGEKREILVALEACYRMEQQR